MIVAACAPTIRPFQNFAVGAGDTPERAGAPIARAFGAVNG
jgi:hypothetical protein